MKSEILHANFWQNKDRKHFANTLERTFPLVELSLSDPKWQDDRYVLKALRKELKKFHAGTRTDSIEVLYRAL